MATIDLPHGRVHYRVTGPDDSAAPPVVFVHGLLVNGELWTKAADELAKHGIRSYAPDLPLGSHPIPLTADADLSPRGVAVLIDDFMAGLGLDDVTLVGNDTGGALCQFLVDARPQRVGRLMLTNCDAFDAFPPAPFGLIVRIGRHEWGIRSMLLLMRLTTLRHSLAGFGGLVRDTLDPQLTRRWITPARTDAAVRRDLSKFLRQVRPADLVDVSSRLGRFRKPVSLVWGAKDPFFKLSFAHRLKATFPDATVVEVATGRTFLPLDEPQRIADEIRILTRRAGQVSVPEGRTEPPD